ncbi:hypothetical protein PO909_032412 [Leuciscus waleckii]
MKKAFAKINVDRNTIARTAIIAELAITYPDTFQELPTDEVKEKISEFAERCKRAMTKEMAETITAKKKSGQLLPIIKCQNPLCEEEQVLLLVSFLCIVHINKVK